MKEQGEPGMYLQPSVPLLITRLGLSRSEFCPVGVFTIIDTEEADGYTWGLLKSEEGWLALEFTERIN